MSIRTKKGTTAKPSFSFPEDPDTGFHSPAAGVLSVVADGVEMQRWSTSIKGTEVAKVALNAVDTAGGLFAWVAPADCFLTRVLIDVTTKSTGACTVDIGYTTVSATTSVDTLLDGLDVGTAAGLFDNCNDTNNGTNGVSLATGALRVASGKWVTGSKASGATAGIVGYAYIHYTRA